MQGFGGELIAKNLKPKTDCTKRIFLDQLPRILKGYGKTPNCGHIIIICNLDNKDKKDFLQQLNNILNKCTPKPSANFCISVEEFEAWYLGNR